VGSDYPGYVDPKVGPEDRCGHCGCPLVWMDDVRACPIDGWPREGYDQPAAEIVGILSRETTRG
jgi:hypothetical protein